MTTQWVIPLGSRPREYAECVFTSGILLCTNFGAVCRFEYSSRYSILIYFANQNAIFIRTTSLYTIWTDVVVSCTAPLDLPLDLNVNVISSLLRSYTTETWFLKRHIYTSHRLQYSATPCHTRGTKGTLEECFFSFLFLMEVVSLLTWKNVYFARLHGLIIKVKERADRLVHLS